MDLDEALDALTADPGSAGILTDFDGSLAPIVQRPEDAQPVPGAAQALTALAGTFALVAVVSGRSLGDLRVRFAPDGVLLCGSYGRERADRVRSAGPDEPDWEALLVSAAARTRELPGVIVEPKGLGIAIHYRLAPDLRAAVERLSVELAGEFGMEVRPGRLVAELTVPGPGKAEAVAGLVADHKLRTALFAGDDVADVEAFEMLRRMDVTSVLVAVASEESPPALSELADIVLSHPRELSELFGRLASVATRLR